jgi:hypothetical protein
VGKLREGFKVQPIDVDNEVDIRERLAVIDTFLADFSLPPQRSKTSRNVKEKT